MCQDRKWDLIGNVLMCENFDHLVEAELVHVSKHYCFSF